MDVTVEQQVRHCSVAERAPRDAPPPRAHTHIDTHIVDNRAAMRLEDVCRHRLAHVSEPYEADPGAAGGELPKEDGENSGVRGAAENTGARRSRRQERTCAPAR